MSTTTACRLCGGRTAARFTLPSAVAGELRYRQCVSCESLQTQFPNWLDRAYADGAIGEIDTGALYRSQLCAARVWVLAKVVNLTESDPILDVGGAYGALARCLRDLRLDAYVEDPYTPDVFNRPFEIGARAPRLVTAIEVIEHFAEPRDDLASVFDRGAEFVLVSTRRYQGQGSDWYYLAPYGGQHVFFYSHTALRLIAERFGYHVVTGDEFSFFSHRPLSIVQRLAVRAIAHPAGARLAMAGLSLCGRPGRDPDQESIIAGGAGPR